MTRALVRACPVCSNDRGDVRHVQTLAIPDELGFADGFAVVTCSRCGFAFADIAITQQQLDQSYEEHSKYADETLLADAASSDPPWDTERLAGVAAWLSEQIQERDLRILDAGCAGGSFLGSMKAHGFSSLVGIDPSPRAAAIARRRHGVEAVAESFLAMPAALGSFGLVTLHHTLEHLGNVRGAVAALRSVLDDDGLAYLEVPNARCYADYLTSPFQDFNTEHINHFSLATLDRLMQSAGFVAVALGEKTIFASSRHQYPAAFGLWRKDIASESLATVAYDEPLVEGIVRYISESHALMAQIDAALRNSLSSSDAVYLWGTGQLAFKLARDTVLATKQVTFVDGSPEKQGLHINGSAIIAPADVAADDRPIVLGSILAADSIAAAIRGRFGDDRRIVRLPERVPA